jgi:hypothetical protein
MRALRKAREQRGPRGDAARAGGIRTGKSRPIEGKLVEIGRLDNGMTVNPKAVPTPLIHADQDYIFLFNRFH